MTVKMNYVCHFPVESPVCNQAKEFIALAHRDVEVCLSHIEAPPMPPADKPIMPTLDEIKKMEACLSEQFAKKINEVNTSNPAVTLLSSTNDPIDITNKNRHIPVVGMGYATYWTACSLADQFAILTPFQGFEQIYRETLAQYGLESRCHSIKSFPHNPYDVGLNLSQDDSLIQNCIKIIRELVMDGVTMFAMGCGSPHVSFNALKLNRVTQSEMGVTILSPLHVGIEMCKSLAQSKQPTISVHS